MRDPDVVKLLTILQCLWCSQSGRAVSELGVSYASPHLVHLLCQLRELVSPGFGIGERERWTSCSGLFRFDGPGHFPDKLHEGMGYH